MDKLKGIVKVKSSLEFMVCYKCHFYSLGPKQFKILMLFGHCVLSKLVIFYEEVTALSEKMQVP